MGNGSKVAIFLGLTLSVIGMVWGISNIIGASNEVDETFKDCIAQAGYEYCRTEVCDDRDGSEKHDCINRMIEAYEVLYEETIGEEPF